MARTLDGLLRRCTIDGHPTVDARAVCYDDGRAALIGRVDGQLVAVAVLAGATYERHPNGTVTITNGAQTLAGQVDQRCGGCAGRAELTALNPAEFLPAPASAE